MASRKVPTFFYDSRTLKVSVSLNEEERTFYISPGLIIVGGKYFFFEGGGGELLEPPCRIGFEVKGTFKEDYDVFWPKHGDKILLRAFLYNLSEESLSSVEKFAQESDFSPECKKEYLKIGKYERYPSSYKTVRFISEIEEVTPTCLSLDSKNKNFKILATLIKGNHFYQHQYGPIYFEPLYTKGKSPENIAMIRGDMFDEDEGVTYSSPDWYATAYIDKDIVLI